MTHRCIASLTRRIATIAVCAALLFASVGLPGLLAGGDAVAASDPAPLPRPTGDMTLSSSGPLALTDAPLATAGGASAQAVRRGDDTYTYLRCWYRKSRDPLAPEATYEWALDPGSVDWYRVPGYWWADGMTQWKNMFYSATTQHALNDVCRKTLAARGIRAPLTQAVAANNPLSFNFTIWTLDSARQDTRIDRLIVFGDSLSDTQNMFNASQWQLPNRMSWHAGRFSNGSVWPEYLAEALQLPMFNWAVGGAANDQYLVVPGLVQQVESWRDYMQFAPDYQPGNTLFAVFNGGNDLVSYGRTPEQAASALRDSLEQLADAGATSILLFTLPDVSRAPLVATRADAARVALQVKDYNRMVVDAAAALRVRYGTALRIEIFDAYSVFNDLLLHPARYGLDDTTHACLDIPNPTSVTYLSPQTPGASCRDPARFLFWDALHPTTRTHAILAERVAWFVQERFGI